MKKLLMLFVIAFVMVVPTRHVMAEKPASCSTIKDGTITDSVGQLVSLGYDKWGYNYQANMFNGFYDNYTRPAELATSGDRLMMKWNDAWLSSKDCDGDNKLDRHFGYPTYKDSGAWLTNHAQGSYDSYNIAGTQVFDYEWNGGHYPNDVVLNQSGSNITGTIGWPSAADPYLVIGTVVGTVTDNTVTLTVDYNDRPYDRSMTGTISPDGSITGTWVDANISADHGSWSTTTGSSEITACTWSDFVKIVAVPSSSLMVDDKWTTADGVEIGPVIWGDFAIIQEISDNPCGNDLGLLNYKSKLRSGLGNW